ncbi:hypothetical protein SDC9_86517 [bioreactor metagenome]|uniref:Uncharacterized protein n=1 Tax=bioreactor metagenome TaxID=1076179 RepID=A0A644ZJ57_9ZZZZ
MIGKVGLQLFSLKAGNRDCEREDAQCGGDDERRGKVPRNQHACEQAERAVEPRGQILCQHRQRAERGGNAVDRAGGQQNVHTGAEKRREHQYQREQPHTQQVCAERRKPQMHHDGVVPEVRAVAERDCKCQPVANAPDGERREEFDRNDLPARQAFCQQVDERAALALVCQCSAE